MSAENVNAPVVERTPTASDPQTLNNKVKISSDDRSALESKIADKFNVAFADEPAATEATPTQEETPQGTDAADKSEEASEDVKDATETSQEEKTEVEEKEAVTDPVVAVAAKKTGPTLPDSYRRSLKSYGWEDEDIDQNLAVLGDRFISTAAKIHQNRNEEVTRWADAGRAIRQNQPEEKKTELQVLKPLDQSKLEEHYGNDKMIGEIIGPVNAVIQQINAIMPMVMSSQQATAQAELETLGKQVEGFFGGKELEPYRELYGDSKEPLKDQHFQARNKVLDTANALIVGAKQNGRSLTLGEALQLSHDAVSGGFKAKAARTTLVKQVKTREKGISLPPSGHKTSVTQTGPKDRATFEKDTAARLKRVFT